MALLRSDIGARQVGELPALSAEEELSLEDLEDEDEEDEHTDILDEEGPAEVGEEKG